MKKITVFLAVLFLLQFTGFASAEYIDNGDATITDTSEKAETRFQGFYCGG